MSVARERAGEELAQWTTVSSIYFDELLAALDELPRVIPELLADPGMILVDDAGMSLYMYDPDGQGASTCYDDCAAQWPPLVVEADPVAGDGIDAALLGTVERDDGTTQVTYDGWPLYTWVQDSAPGDTTGQGVGGIWWVIGPDGVPIR